jgi:hypothetical protein
MPEIASPNSNTNRDSTFLSQILRCVTSEIVPEPDSAVTAPFAAYTL